jgi:hypothetical protein
MRLALDTNILVYAEGLNDATRKAQARELLSKLARADVVLPVQVAGELFRVLVRKARRTPAEARLAVEGWQDLFGSEPTTPPLSHPLWPSRPVTPWTSGIRRSSPSPPKPAATCSSLKTSRMVLTGTE